MMKCKEKRGFTAIEIAVVATIIAILSLLVIPLFRERSKQAKIAAAYDDMQSLGKAEQLAYAECNIYLRLQDLDNTSTYEKAGTLDYDTILPIAAWNRFFVLPGASDAQIYANGERMTLARNYKGPYAAHNSSLMVQDLYNAGFKMFSTDTGLSSGLPGPVPYDGKTYNAYDRYPVDPWKGPFIFFAEQETIINNKNVTLSSVIYCLGPDGLPGDGGDPTNADNFQRPEIWSASPLGTGDDLVYRF